MNIQIASFAMVPEHIYVANNNFKTEKLILVLSNENKNEVLIKSDQEKLQVKAKIDEVLQFYKKLNISTENIFVDYKDFLGMTIQLFKKINSFSDDDQILLNLSGGRRSISMALLYASTFISNFRELEIQCVVIPEDKSYIPFNLLPKHIPDEKDVNLLSKLSLKKPLTELEDSLKLKQPTISLRLKKLEKYGYVIVKGRNRELTSLGQLVVNIYSSNINKKKEGI